MFYQPISMAGKQTYGQGLLLRLRRVFHHSLPLDACHLNKEYNRLSSNGDLRDLRESSGGEYPKQYGDPIIPFRVTKPR